MEENLLGVGALGGDDLQDDPAIGGAGQKPVVGDGQGAGLVEGEDEGRSGGFVVADPGVADRTGSVGGDVAGEVDARGVAVPGDARRIIQDGLHGHGGQQKIQHVFRIRRNVAQLLEVRDAGLYFRPEGDFHIDPVLPVARALITHAHSDHARAGSQSYLTSRRGEALVRARVGGEAAIQSETYGAKVRIGGVEVSFHPAGHILGSAQIRIERGGEVWVVSGDYKLAADPTCMAFEPVRCHTFVTESTFALPVFRWPDVDGVVHEIEEWWRGNREAGRASILACVSSREGATDSGIAGCHCGGPVVLH